MEPAPAPVPSKSVWTLLKAIPWLTLLGAGATLAFLILCRYDNTVIRWQLMLPLAAVGAGLLVWRRKRAPVWEARVCTLLLAVLFALVVLRDVGLSRKLAELYDKIESYKSQYHQATSEIRRFFEGTR